MRFEWPFLLLALLLVPATVAAYLLLERRRARYALRFTNLDVLASVVERTPPWRRYVPPALFLLALAVALVALARPQAAVSVPQEEAGVVLTIDTSGSMLAADVKPTRLGAVQVAVKRFLKKLPDKFKVGIVTFSSEAQVAAPLSRDRQTVLEALNFVYPGGGTAIGDAIARSVDVARDVPGAPIQAAPDSPPPAAAPPTAQPRRRPLRAILLLSDGFQTRGTLTPVEGARRARSYGIPVYTIALGTPQGTITFTRGPFSRTIQVPPDPHALEEIAAETGGTFYAAPNAATLNGVYDRLGSSIGRTRKWREATYAFLGGAAALLLAAGALAGRWHGRLP